VKKRQRKTLECLFGGPIYLSLKLLIDWIDGD